MRLLCFVLALLSTAVIFADSIDDAEAKRRSVPVSQVQLERAQEQIRQLQSDLTDARLQIQTLTRERDEARAKLGQSVKVKPSSKLDGVLFGLKVGDAMDECRETMKKSGCQAEEKDNSTNSLHFKNATYIKDPQKGAVKTLTVTETTLELSFSSDKKLIGYHYVVAIKGNDQVANTLAAQLVTDTMKDTIKGAYTDKEINFFDLGPSSETYCNVSWSCEGNTLYLQCHRSIIDLTFTSAASYPAFPSPTPAPSGRK